MGFPVKNDPQVVKSEEKLVNVEKITTEEKETPVKTPLVEPINADVDKSQLGIRKDQVFNSKFGAGVAVPFSTPMNPEGRKVGASINNASIQPKIHNIRIEDYSRADHKKYNYLVHCTTCGWQGRYATESMAKSAADTHRDATKRAA